MDKGDRGKHDGMFMAHETDVPLRVAFPSRWGACWGDSLGVGTLHSVLIYISYMHEFCEHYISVYMPLDALD